MTFRAIATRLARRHYPVLVIVGLFLALNLYGQLYVGGDIVDMKGRMRGGSYCDPVYLVGWPFTYAEVLKHEWLPNRSRLVHFSITDLFCNVLTATCFCATVVAVGRLRRRHGAKRALSTIEVMFLILVIAVGCSWWVHEGCKHLTELAIDENLHKYGAGLQFDDCAPVAVSRIVPRKYLARFVRATALYCNSETDDNAIRTVSADLRALKFLNELDLQESAVSDDGLREIVRDRRIQIINVSDTRIVGTGLAGLEPDCLRELTAENSGFNDLGMQSIIDQRRLFEINLNNCPVSDAGLECMAQCGKLYWILLEGTKISDESLDRVLQGFKDASFMSLKNIPDVSAESVGRLRRALPRTTIRNK